MRWFIPALVAVLLIAACAGGTATSPSALPSKACGGFHLVVENATASDLEVRLNGETVTLATPGSIVDIAQFGARSLPAMPWAARVVRRSDGTALYAADLAPSGTDGVRVLIEDSPVARASVSPWTC